MYLSHKPRLKIRLPVYNGKRFMAQAIVSYIGQIFADFRLINPGNWTLIRFLRSLKFGGYLRKFGNHLRTIVRAPIGLDQKLRYALFTPVGLPRRWGRHRAM